MKKTIFTVLAVAALVACAKEEVVTVNQEAIAFENAFVDNATKTTDNSFSAAKLPTEFIVYGTTQHLGQDAVSIFNGVQVAKDGNVYKYSTNNTQYWIDGNEYNFAALVNAAKADVTCSDLMPVSVAYTAVYDATTGDTPDLMYSTPVTREGEATGNETVKFTFNHLLANVKFTIENTMTNNPELNLYEYTVTDIKINNAYTTGTCALATKSWSDQEDNNKVVKFGNVAAVGAATKKSAASDYARLVIPGTYTDLNITFTLTTTLNSNVVNIENLTITPDVTFEAGKSYNLLISKNNPGEVIEFSVQTVTGWVNGGDVAAN